MLNYTDITEK